MLSSCFLTVRRSSQCILVQYSFRLDTCNLTEKEIPGLVAFYKKKVFYKKKLFLTISKNLQKTCIRVSFTRKTLSAAEKSESLNHSF